MSKSKFVVGNVSKFEEGEFLDVVRRAETHLRRKDRLSCVPMGEEYWDNLFSCVRKKEVDSNIEFILRLTDLSAHLIRFDWVFEAYFFYEVAIQSLMCLDASAAHRTAGHNVLLAMAKLLKVSCINGHGQYTARADELFEYLVQEYHSSEAKDYL